MPEEEFVAAVDVQRRRISTPDGPVSCRMSVRLSAVLAS
jgi:hypothetical protein